MRDVNEEQILHAILEGTSDLIQSIKLDGSLEYVNPIWLNTLQYTEDEIDNITLKDFILSGYVRKMEEALLKVLRGQCIQDFVATFQTKESTPVQVEGILFPRFKGKDIVAAVGIFRNINEQNRILDELRHEQARSEVLLDLMTFDLTNINQEILTTLEAALSTPELPQSLEDLLREGVNEVERGSNFLSNVKKLWRIARKTPRMFHCDLGEVLFVAKEIVEKTFPHKELTLTTNLELNQYHVTADEYLIEVLKSLFHHIMKVDRTTNVLFEVEVESLSHTPFLKIQIKDNGPGIIDEEKSRVFNDLSQRHDSSRGLGLGLTLTKHVLENYGGYVRVEDRIEGVPEKGSNFILLLRGSQVRNSDQKSKSGVMTHFHSETNRKHAI